MSHEIIADERWVSMGCCKAADKRHHFHVTDRCSSQEAECIACGRFIVYLRDRRTTHPSGVAA